MKSVGNATVLNSSTSARTKGRAKFAAVKRTACNRCSGAYWDRSLSKPTVEAPGFLCECPDGWVGTTTKLGVIADSGPTTFFARMFWRMRNDFAADVNALSAFLRRRP